MRSERDLATGSPVLMRRPGVCATALAMALALTMPAMGQDFTPLGAETSGNAAGTIPPWQGGLKSPPAGHRSGGPYADPFEADVPMFAIGVGNLDQYRGQLSPGQIALLQKYPTLKMNVY